MERTPHPNSRLRSLRRHLNYANIAATLALFFAISGGALAAKHYLINSTKQINPKVLKKLRGRTGRTGATGREGAPGKEGPFGPIGKEGKEGKRGPAGKEGKEGEPGPFVTTLPSGKTLTGVFQRNETLAAEAEGYVEAPISFAFPLAAAPNVEVLEPGQAPTANCPGTPESPSAASGYVCLYTISPATIPVGTFNPANEGQTVGRNGVVAFIKVKCGVEACGPQLVGTWAVTAP